MPSGFVVGEKRQSALDGIAILAGTAVRAATEPAAAATFAATGAGTGAGVLDSNQREILNV